MADFSQIKARARLLNKKNEALRNSSAYARVIGVLAGLGFLVAPGMRKLATSKVSLLEAIELGRAVEPRILEVLPAALISFPRSFLHVEDAPGVFKDIVRALKTRSAGPDFEGIRFEKFLEAANRPTKNRKRKTLDRRRISKTFRFSPATTDLLVSRAQERGLSSTRYIESLIVKDSNSA